MSLCACESEEHEHGLGAGTGALFIINGESEGLGGRFSKTQKKRGEKKYS